jgi:hypothetical protein
MARNQADKEPEYSASEQEESFAALRKVVYHRGQDQVLEHHPHHALLVTMMACPRLQVFSARMGR